MKIKNKNVLVYGMSCSGVWASRLLVKYKANVFIYDDNPNKLVGDYKNCFIVKEIDEKLMSGLDFLVVSPSIQPDNIVIQLAKSLKKPVLSEIELASYFSKNYIAITGTNGKTTTVQLIEAMFKTTKKAIACGNIGYSFSQAVLENKKAIHIVEVSSFMLENIDKFSPHVATILNIAQDHLIRHKTMQNYASIKHKIYKNLTKNDYIVENLDLNLEIKSKAKRIGYSLKSMADVCLQNGHIFIKTKSGYVDLISLDQISLKGEHNLYNVMCAICFALIYKLKLNKIKKVLTNFKLADYRMSVRPTINGVNFINDSKSTNIASTLASVQATKGEIVLILGGSKKGLDLDELFQKLPKKVKSIVAYGEIREELKQKNNEKFEFFAFKTLNLAFKKAVEIATVGDTVLFSPATASYDQYLNYVERGKAFDEKVKEYESSSQKK